MSMVMIRFPGAQLYKSSQQWWGECKLSQGTMQSKTASYIKAEKVELAFEGADIQNKIKTGCSGKISFASAFTSIFNGFTRSELHTFFNYITCVAL